MTRYRKHKPNFAEPNWSHRAPNIQCRMDWDGATVWEFPAHRKAGRGIVAYTLEEALEVLNNLAFEEEPQDDCDLQRRLI